MSSPVPANAASPRSASADADTAPLSAPRRLGLLLILLILPVIAVCLPAIFVTLVFGQRPHPAALAAAPELSGTPIRTQVAHAMKGHVIGRGLLVGTYERA